MGGGERKAHLGRVLVVDDDATIRRTCGRVLGAEGWGVVEAHDGSAALDVLAASRAMFDCVLSDVNMPGVDGFELVAKVRELDDDIPVLLMTGDPNLDSAVKAIDSGAVSYITKPFASESLAAAVARAARRHGVARMRRRAESYARALGGTDAAERADLERRFGLALERSWMAFQPIIDIKGRRVFAYEALIRTDEETLRRPDLLIATAERLARVHQLGRTVRAAVARAAADAPPDVQLFVNVHGLELGDEQLYDANAALSRLASRVVLEITERVGLDTDVGTSRVAMLRQLGYRIAVDDLGAGYAALGALAHLEPEIVKLDMSIVRDLDRSATKRRVVAAMATLCRELGGRVVAEGVETAEESDACIACGVDLLQGYLFAKPSRGFASVTF